MVLLLFIIVGIAVTLEGSKALPLKDHRKFGEGISEGKQLGSKRVAEHISEKASPAVVVVEPVEEEMVTGSRLKRYPKFTVKRMHVQQVQLMYTQVIMNSQMLAYSRGSG